MEESKMRQNDLSVSQELDEKDSYVRKTLTKTLLKLLKDESLKEISISSLCDIAGVGRASFYRNFKSKEDILKQYDQKLIKKWGEAFEQDENSTIELLIPSLLIHYKKYKDFYFIVYRENLSSLVLDTILHACKLQEKSTNIEAYVTSFIGYGLFEWIGRGMEETPEQLLSYINQK